MRAFTNFAYAVGLLMMLPIPGKHSEAPAATDQYVAVATSAFSDLGFLCSRQPDFCRAAAEVALSVKGNAMNGFDIVYSWAKDTAEFRYLAVPGDLASLLLSEQTGPKLRSTFKD
jgi:hypothetical protein